jgi:hypothetical protein
MIRKALSCFLRRLLRISRSYSELGAAPSHAPHGSTAEFGAVFILTQIWWTSDRRNPRYFVIEEKSKPRRIILNLFF